jgi:eukaryotic-like serine/threonine-protein kinase
VFKMPLLSDGQKIGKKFVVERYLGEGSFAEVYRVRQVLFKRDSMLALKILKTPIESIEKLQEDFEEAWALSNLNHPNIIRVFEADILEQNDEEYGYITMEYIAGGTLETLHLSYTNKTVPVDLAMELTKQICEGLAQAHSRNPPIIHRDIKPQNIMVKITEKGRVVKLADFGLATELNPRDLMAEPMGTIAFKAPEARYGVDNCAGDVWAIGVTLYLLLTQNLPYEINSIDEIRTGKCYLRELKSANYYNPFVDSEIDEIIKKALSVKPEKRYKNAEEMLNALNLWERPEEENVMSSPSQKNLKEIYERAEKPSKEEIENKVEIALQKAKNGELSEAANLMEEAVNQDPEIDAKYNARLRLWRATDPDISLANKAMDSCLEGELTQAIELLQEAKANTQNTTQQKQYQKTLQLWTSTNPPQSLETEAQKQANQGNLTQAITLLKQAKANTQNTTQQKQYQKTLQLWTSTNPPQSLETEAQKQANQGNLTQAITLLKQAKANTQNTEQENEFNFSIKLLESFKAARKKDNLEKASELLKKAIKIDPVRGNEYEHRLNLWMASKPSESLVLEAEKLASGANETGNRILKLSKAADLLEDAIAQKEIYKNDMLLEKYRIKINNWRKGFNL